MITSAKIIHKIGVGLLLALSLMAGLLATKTKTLYAHESDDPAHPPHVTFAVDETLTPIKGEKLMVDDGDSHLVATLTDDNGQQTDFLADTLLVATDDPTAIKEFLKRWDGILLAAAKAADAKEPAIITRYTVQINTALADLTLLEKYAEQLHGQGHYRVSSKAGLQLLAAVTSEIALGKVEVAVRWVDFADAVTPETIGRVKALQTALKRNCGQALVAHLRLLRDVMEGGPRGELAEQQLQGIVVDMSDCNPPPPTFDLVEDGVLELPIADAGQALGPYVFNPPNTVPAGFHAEIIGAIGTFTADSLYSGAVRLSYNQSQLGLATQPTFALLRPAAETFTIRLTHGSNHWEFAVRQPVRLSILGNHTYSLVPGNSVNIQLRAAGEPGTMNWQWIAESGDAFPPTGLTALQEDANGNATINGVANATNYYTTGRLRVQQNGNVASVPASIQVRVNFHPDLSPCPPVANLAPGDTFTCELSRPIGYDQYTWTEIAGALPTGLQLNQHNIRWYIEGTVASTTPSGASPVGLYSATYRLQGNNLHLATRDLAFNIGIPFRAWSQNMIMRPNNPFVPTYGDDNEERTDLLINRINAGTYDIIALQEFLTTTSATSWDWATIGNSMICSGGQPMRKDSLVKNPGWDCSLLTTLAALDPCPTDRMVIIPRSLRIAPAPCRIVSPTRALA
ncbi:MAG: hypothetical protein R2867_28740 [Caldilineaceae bacterium]